MSKIKLINDSKPALVSPSDYDFINQYIWEKAMVDGELHCVTKSGPDGEPWLMEHLVLLRNTMHFETKSKILCGNKTKPICTDEYLLFADWKYSRCRKCEKIFKDRGYDKIVNKMRKKREKENIENDEEDEIISEAVNEINLN